MLRNKEINTRESMDSSIFPAVAKSRSSGRENGKKIPEIAQVTLNDFFVYLYLLKPWQGVWDFPEYHNILHWALI